MKINASKITNHNFKPAKNMKIQSLFLILVLILQSITACKKDVSSSEALEGKWGRSNEWDNGYIFHEELNFRGDGTVEII